MNRARAKLMGVAVALAGLSTVVAPAVPGQASELAVCSAHGPIAATSLPSSTRPDQCDLQGRTIDDSGLTAVVPPPGKGVYAEKLTPSGAAQFAIETDSDGVVKILMVGDELRLDDSLVRSIASASHSGGGSSPAACDDTTRWAYAKQSETHLWRYNPTFQPSGFTDTAGENAMKAGFDNIQFADNDCGMPDEVLATHNYQGRTSSRAQVSSSGCPSWFSTDDTNVVDWGPLYDPTLALTCTWYFPIPGTTGPEGSEVLESDTLFRNSGVSWTTTMSGCSNRYDIEGVMTHEAGHSYGLLHPGTESAHGHLTMSPVIDGTCQTNERTLGRGDVLGLEDLYGLPF